MQTKSLREMTLKRSGEAKGVGGNFVLFDNDNNKNLTRCWATLNLQVRNQQKRSNKRAYICTHPRTE